MIAVLPSADAARLRQLLTEHRDYCLSHGEALRLAAQAPNAVKVLLAQAEFCERCTAALLPTTALSPA